MPKCVIDSLEVKYEPIVKDVLQLDGSILKTMGILRNVEMALYACIGCSIVQDISIIEVKPHFVVCISRDFTTQIGGYISFDWSYMFFLKKVWNQSFNQNKNYQPSIILSPTLLISSILILPYQKQIKMTQQMSPPLLQLGYLISSWMNGLILISLIPYQFEHVLYIKKGCSYP